MDFSTPTVSPLRQRMLEDMRMRKLEPKTQAGYLRAVRKLAAFLKASPDTASAEDLRRFQMHLVDGGASPITLNSTISGLKFFFDITLGQIELMARMQPVKVPHTLPVVLSTDEVTRLIAAARNVKHQAALSVAYGAGLRASGSNTSVLDDVFVPEHRSVSFQTLRDGCSPGSKVNTNPIYRTPFIAVHTYALLAPSLGLARSGYADFTEWTKQRYLTYTQINIAQHVPVQLKIAEIAAQIAAISAHGDTFVGGMVADAVEKVGAEGVITVEEAKGTETVLEVVDGMQFDRGYLSSYFVTDAERMEVSVENAYILLHEKKISNLRDLLPILEQTMQKARPLLIIAEDIEGEALAALVVAKADVIAACTCGGQVVAGELTAAIAMTVPHISHRSVDFKLD